MLIAIVAPESVLGCPKGVGGKRISLLDNQDVSNNVHGTSEASCVQLVCGGWFPPSFLCAANPKPLLCAGTPACDTQHCRRVLQCHLSREESLGPFPYTAALGWLGQPSLCALSWEPGTDSPSLWEGCCPGNAVCPAALSPAWPGACPGRSAPGALCHGTLEPPAWPGVCPGARGGPGAPEPLALHPCWMLLGTGARCGSWTCGRFGAVSCCWRLCLWDSRPLLTTPELLPSMACFLS